MRGDHTTRRPVHRRMFLAGLTGVAGGALFTACGAKGETPSATRIAMAGVLRTVAPGKPFTVAATTTQIQDFVQNVGGSRIAVSGILKPNVDPHDYEPTVSDANMIGGADLLLVHGIGLDAWIGKTIKSASASAPLVTTTDGLPLLKGDTNSPESDPHVWFDPTLVQMMVTNIASAVAKADPANDATYQQNAKTYRDQLTRLDLQLRDIFASVPKERRKLVTNHDGFQYLAKRYDLTIVGAVIPRQSDTAEPAAKEISDLIGTIKKEQVKAIFAESSANPKVARQVASETGIAIVDTLFGDTLGAPGSEGETYLKMMHYNATTIANALK